MKYLILVLLLTSCITSNEDQTEQIQDQPIQQNESFDLYEFYTPENLDTLIITNDSAKMIVYDLSITEAGTEYFTIDLSCAIKQDQFVCKGTSKGLDIYDICYPSYNWKQEKECVYLECGIGNFGSFCKN